MSTPLTMLKLARQQPMGLAAVPQAMPGPRKYWKVPFGGQLPWGLMEQNPSWQHAPYCEQRTDGHDP